MQFLNGSLYQQSVYRNLLKEFNHIESELQIKDILIKILPYFLLYTRNVSPTQDYQDFIEYIDKINTQPKFAKLPEFFYSEQDLFDSIQKTIKKKEVWQKIVSLFQAWNFDLSEDSEPNSDNPAITPELLGYLHEERVQNKKHKGVFYTPKFVAKTMCRRALYYYICNSVDSLCKETFNSLINLDLSEIANLKKSIRVGKEELEKLKQILTKVRILDNACGTGVFLISMLNELFRLNRIIELLMTETEEMINSNKTIHILTDIIRNSLFGIDIDEEAVKITKIRLYFTVYSLASPIGTISKEDLEVFSNTVFNIQTGNSLMDSIFDGSFNIIIGNPPYVKEYENRSIFEPLKNSPYYQGKMDIWYLFACSAIDMLQNNGILAYIAQNNWITSYGAKKLREKIRTSASVLEFVDFNEYKIFGKAEIQTMIMYLKKEPPFPSYKVLHKRILSEKISDSQLYEFLQKIELNRTPHFNIENIWVETQASGNGDDSFRFHDTLFREISDEISSNPDVESLTAEEIGNGCDVHQYKVTRDHLLKLERNGISNKSNHEFRLNQGIFVLEAEEINKIQWSDRELKEILKPFYTSEDIDRYFISKTNRYWIIYTKSDINSKIDVYPNVKAHLDKFQQLITSDNRPYGLHRARKQSLFEGKKILSLRKTPRPIFTYSDAPLYVGQSYFIIQPKRIDYFYLLGILNSKFIAYWLKHKGKMQGKHYQIDLEPLLTVPIIKSTEHRDSIAILTELIVKTQRITPISDILDFLVYELYFHHSFYKLGLYASDERLLSKMLHYILDIVFLSKSKNSLDSLNSKELNEIVESLKIYWSGEKIQEILKKIENHCWIQRIQRDLSDLHQFR